MLQGGKKCCGSNKDIAAGRRKDLSLFVRSCCLGALIRGFPNLESAYKTTTSCNPIKSFAASRLLPPPSTAVFFRLAAVPCCCRNIFAASRLFGRQGSLMLPPLAAKKPGGAQLLRANCLIRHLNVQKLAECANVAFRCFLVVALGKNA